MGLFDGLRRSREVALTPRAAMLLARISMVAADGDVEESEMDIIRRIDGSGETGDWQRALESWKRIRSSAECVALTAPHLNADQRRFTLANLVDIAMADGTLAGAENALLERYVEAYQLDEAFVRDLVKVVAVKNDRAPFL